MFTDRTQNREISPSLIKSNQILQYFFFYIAPNLLTLHPPQQNNHVHVANNNRKVNNRLSSDI